MFSAKSFDLKLKRQRSGEIIIDQIKLNSDRIYSTFAEDNQKKLKWHPLLFTKVRQVASNLTFERHGTVHITLAAELADEYVRNDKLYYDNKPLLTIAEKRKKELSFAKRMRSLKFDLRKNDIQHFVSEFKEITTGIDSTAVKTSLKAKIPLEYHDPLKDSWPKSMDELYDDLIRFFDGKIDAQRNRLNSLSLANCKSVEEFVESKFELFGRFIEGIAMPDQINSILSQFPRPIREEFLDSNGKRKVSAIYLSQKDSFLSFLAYACKQHPSAIKNKPLKKSDRLREQFAERSRQGDNLNSTVQDCSHESTVIDMDLPEPERVEEEEILMEEDHEEPIEFPDKLNYSLFEEILNQWIRIWMLCLVRTVWSEVDLSVSFSWAHLSSL